MNERIRELANEAEDYADAIVDQGGDFHLAYTRKFAELIVQECTKVLSENSELRACVIVGKHFMDTEE